MDEVAAGIDPLDPTSTPVKRTALGRFKHERLAADVAPLQFRCHRAHAGAWLWFSWIGD